MNLGRRSAMRTIPTWLAALLVTSVLALTAAPAAAKLPVPPETPESKAKAQEVADKAAAAARRETEDLLRYQDKAVANYKQRQAK